jgi:hypothetical protein
MSDLAFTIDAATFAKAAKLAAACVQRRNTVPILGNALLIVADGALSITTTDLDSAVTIALGQCDLAADGAVTVPAHDLASLAAKAAKGTGRLIDAKIADDRLILCSGRSRFNLPILPRDEFPIFAVWEAAETWEAAPADAGDCRAEGFSTSDDARKLFAKAAKYIGASSAQFSRRDGDDGPDRYRMESYANAPGKILVAVETKLEPPQLERWKPQRAPLYSYGCDREAWAKASSYLRTLRIAHDLPLIGGHEGELIAHEGCAIGMTFGDCRIDYNETRPMPNAWSPPAGTEIIASGCLEDCTIDGVEYGRIVGEEWNVRYIAEQPGALVWAEGAYSLPMPAEQRQPVSAVTVEVDGIVQPLRVKCRGEGTAEIQLTADQVRELCGPVDPSTFVEIPSLVFHHGRLLGHHHGMVQRGYCHALPPTVSDGRKVRRMTDREQMDAYCADPRAWLERIAAKLDGEPLIGFAPPATPTAALPAGEPVSNVVAFPVLDYAEPAIAEEATPDPDAVVRLLADCARPVVPPAASDALEQRLARLEAALGLADQPKRSPAHAAAITRAWKARTALRFERSLQESLNIAAAQRERQNKAEIALFAARIARMEGLAAERTELVAEIDGLRGALERATQLKASRDRIGRRATTLRRDLARTRAERDGIAANLHAMSRRVADDAALIERLQPAGGDRPRFILSTRMEA